MTTTSPTSRALARKDLLLELRAKETLPSMLLFVIAALTIFHFALPRGTSHTAALGLLWAALIFTALLGLTRAFVAEREQGMFDALVLAPCDRSAIWLGEGARGARLPRRRRGRRAAGVRGVLLRASTAAPSRRSRWPTSGSATVGTLFGAMAVAGRARELLLPLLFLPMAIPIVVGGVRAATSGSSCSTTRSSRVLSWAAFEYVVSET